MQPALIEELENFGIESSYIVSNYFFDLRVSGTDSSITLPVAEIDEMQSLFEEKHRNLFGFSPLRTRYFFLPIENSISTSNPLSLTVLTN